MDSAAQLNPFEYLDYDQRRVLWNAPLDAHFRYDPQGYQEQFHRDMTPRIKAVGGGVGAAKTYTTVMDYAHEALAALARQAMGYVGPDGYTGRIAIAGPDYKQPTMAFEYLRRIWDGLGIIAGDPSMGHERQWRMVSTSGVEVLTITGSKPMAFASRPYTIVHLCESMQQPVGMLNAAVERVSRWPGPFKGKVYCEGTFEDDGYAWYAERCKAWSALGNRQQGRFYSFPSWQNLYNYPGGWDDPEIQALLIHYQEMNSEHLFWERVGGQPPENQSDLWASYFKPMLNNEPHHVHPDAVYDARYPVDVMIDPATHRYAVLFAQWPTPDLMNIIGELVVPKADFDTDIRDAFWELPWAANITPQHSFVSIDRAAMQQHQGMDAHYDQWVLARDQGGMGLTPGYLYLHGDTGLDIVRKALGGVQFKTRINPACAELISDFQTERRDKHGMVTMATNKGHDDCRKALSYYLAQKVGWTTARRPRRQRDSEDHHMIRSTL